MTDRDRRVLVWGAVAIVAAVVCLRLLPWMTRSAIALRDSANSQHATLTRARALLTEQDAVRDSLGRVLAGIVALAPRFVDGNSAAEAQASLSALVSLAASRQSLRLVRLDPLPDSAIGLFSRVALHTELEGDVTGLARLLRAVETAAPVLSVTSLGVTVPDPASRPTQAELLRIELNVAGYYVPRGRGRGTR